MSEPDLDLALRIDLIEAKCKVVESEMAGVTTDDRSLRSPTTIRETRMLIERVTARDAESKAARDLLVVLNDDHSIRCPVCDVEDADFGHHMDGCEWEVWHVATMRADRLAASVEEVPSN
jgi:hypothetical protein